MKTDNAFALGAGAGVLGATAGLTGKRFEHAVAAMNHQIAQDLYALGSTGQLPDVNPVLPLNYRPKGVFRLLLGSIFLGTVFVGALAFIVLAWFGSTSTDYSGGSVFGQALIFGFVIGVLSGWLPGLFIYVARQTMETGKRLTGPVYQRYSDYWEERGLAQAALRNGAVQPVEMAQRLEQHHMDYVLGMDY